MVAVRWEAVGAERFGGIGAAEEEEVPLVLDQVREQRFTIGSTQIKSSSSNL